MTTPPDHDAYLSQVPEPQRAALQALRETIRAAAPGAIETMSYGIPTFKLGARNLVHYAAFRNHCSFFPGSAATTDSFLEELGPYRTGRGTIRFTVDAPLPAELVARVVTARVAEEAARAGK